MLDSEYFFIPDYQLICGPLSEFDPNAVLREVNDDLNSIINLAMSFVEKGTIGDNVGFSMPKTFDYVARELNSHGYVIEGDAVIEYAVAIQEVGKAFMTAVSNHPYWFTRYGTWVGARYGAKSRTGGVEFLLRYSMQKFPQYEQPGMAERVTPTLLAVIEMLFGNLGGKL
ncbi:hypothetical protein ASESINO_30 [Erwinia phage vB_EamM_Asesino]|uniref:Uncharacterized protein n=1 Tax=Erwinia phage vB_EamM_Asesino TaxID=1883370 RepID=A0A1B2I9T8_9CAUD|nr:hypothetical protein ASESINO_30 [Erwinia phage vB_EamM_Asesino]ANZ48043.1 hypothetical protein ASESINO_30 [Erwinia phage vB_EamM_Asesino]